MPRGIGRLTAHGGRALLIEKVRKVWTTGKGNVLKRGKKDFRTNGGVARARK